MSRRAHTVPIARRTLLTGAAAAAGSALVGQSAQAAPARTRSATRPAVAGAVTIPLSYGPFQLYLLDTPIRVYDSRPGQAPNGTDPDLGAGDTRLLQGETRRINVNLVLGNPSLPTGVDSGSDAVLLNIAAVNTIGVSGNLKVWADVLSEPQISCLNWDHASAVIANSVTSRHVAGVIKVKCDGVVGCSTNLIVDAIGWYGVP